MRQQRQQPALVHAVVEEQLLLAAVRRAELATQVGVLDRHREGDLARGDAGAADADPALDQRPEHREEAAVDVLDVGEVAAVLGDVRVAVEHVLAGHPDAVEPQPAVVDAVEPDLGAVVLDPDAVERLPLRVPDRYDERVHALGLPADLQLREDDRAVRVRGGVADVVLAGAVVGSRDHELLALDVVRRVGAERLHVGPVTRLGHREAAQQLAGDEVLEVGVVVVLRAELQDGAAVEPELHADLHQDREVAEAERLEGRDRGTDVTAAAVLGREAEARRSGRCHLLDHLEDPLTELVLGHLDGVVEDAGVLDEVLAGQLTDLGVLAVQQGRERGDVDVGRRVVGHAPTMPHRVGACDPRSRSRASSVRGERRSPGTRCRSSCSGRRRRCGVLR